MCFFRLGLRGFGPPRIRLQTAVAYVTSSADQATEMNYRQMGKLECVATPGTRWRTLDQLFDRLTNLFAQTIANLRPAGAAPLISPLRSRGLRREDVPAHLVAEGGIEPPTSRL